MVRTARHSGPRGIAPVANGIAQSVSVALSPTSRSNEFYDESALCPTIRISESELARYFKHKSYKVIFGAQPKCTILLG
jgi:hypothetical protein